MPGQGEVGDVHRPVLLTLLRLPTRLALAAIIASCATAVALPGAASASTLSVSTTGDHDDGTCDAADCTLREAIAHSAAGDVVSVPAGTYTLTSGELVVSHNLTVDGAGASSAFIDGNNASRVMEVESGVSVTLTGVTIQHGKAPPSGSDIRGGGIRVLGHLALQDSTLTQNQSFDGGGLATDDPAASATLDHVLVTLNGTPGVGGAGGIEQNEGDLTITSSVLSHNQSEYGGAGSLSATTRTSKTVITDTTISDNSAVQIPGANSNISGGGGFTCDCAGSVTITGSTFTNNRANMGGGIYFSGDGTLDVTDSTFSGNHATRLASGSQAEYENGSGGAFSEDGGGHYHFTRATLSGNTADTHGGAAFSTGGPVDFTFSNSTISGNSAGAGGGALRFDTSAQVTISNTTIAGNTAAGAQTGQVGLCDAPPIFQPGPAFTCAPHVTFKATIVSGGQPANCAVGAGSILSQGDNIDSGSSCGFTGASDKQNTDPLLGSLANNGGPTPTMALQSGSPAIDAVSGGCPPPATDQRGAARSAPCDVGAFEYIAAPDSLDTRIAGAENYRTVRRKQVPFAFAAIPSAGATFECSLDLAGFTPCPAEYTTPALSDGTHILKVRARNATTVDSTPAQLIVLVDTVAPTSTIHLDGAHFGDKYAGTVRAFVLADDPAPGAGVASVRCSLDPPTVPQTIGELGACSTFSIGAVGPHVLYAASADGAANLEAVHSVTFIILPAPETTITGGPANRWQRDPTFQFSSTLPGSTFRCALDSVELQSCPTPYTLTNLTSGPHKLLVAAVSAEGVADPTPAGRSFLVASSESHTQTCDIHPFPVPKGDSQIGCGSGTTCPHRVVCGPAVAPCPVSAVCTMDLRMSFNTPQDRFTSPPANGLRLSPGPPPSYLVDGAWAGGAQLGFLPQISCDASYENTLLGDVHGRVHCDAEPTATFFGQNRPVGFYCFELAYKHWSDTYPTDPSTYLDPAPGDTGPDDQRRLHCEMQQIIRPASALEAAAAGEQVQLYVPQPGVVLVIGELPPVGHGTASESRKKPPVPAFRTISKRVTKGGPITLKFKLTKPAAQFLARTGKLRLRLRVQFKPTHGKKSSRTDSVTLTRPPSEKALRRARQEALRYCLRHRTAKRCRARR